MVMVVSERIVEFVEDCDPMAVKLVSRTEEKVVGGTFLRVESSYSFQAAHGAAAGLRNILPYLVTRHIISRIFTCADPDPFADPTSPSSGIWMFWYLAVL